MRPSNATRLILLASFCRSFVQTLCFHKFHSHLQPAALKSLSVLACDTNDYHYGCKVRGGQCVCSYGCPEDYIFRNRAACHHSLLGQDRSVNKCVRHPCLRGICTTTVAEPGFACKCEGTGFYGSRCEKACPTIPLRGQTFPYECVVI